MVATFTQAGATFEIDGVTLFADEAAGVMRYIPAAPTPELDPLGRPAVTVVCTPRAVMLQLGAQFALSNADLAKLQARIAQTKGIQSAVLQPAFINISAAAMMLADQRGVLSDVATSQSSRFSPYNAVFSRSFNGDQGASVVGAVGGRSGVLFIEYRFALTTDPCVQQPNPAMSRRSDVAAWFPPGTGKTHVQFVG